MRRQLKAARSLGHELKVSSVNSILPKMAFLTNRILILFLLSGQDFVGCQSPKDNDPVNTVVYLVKDYINLKFEVDKIVRRGIDMSRDPRLHHLHSMHSEHGSEHQHSMHSEHGSEDHHSEHGSEHQHAMHSEHSSEHQHSMHSKHMHASKQQYKCAFSMLHAARELQEITGLDIQSLLKINKWKDAWESFILKDCSSQRNISCYDLCNKYRTFDGSCNNRQFPTWGMASTSHRRYLPPVYSDGVSTARNKGVEGFALPSARMVSNTVFKARSRPTLDDRLTVLHMAFGQYVAHDLSLTPATADDHGGAIECCDSVYKTPHCNNINIPKSDQHLRHRCMDVVRSVPAADDNCFSGYRDQKNAVTSFLDGSAVYGSSEEKADSLRQFKGGLLKLGVGNGLPKGYTKCFKDVPSDYCQDAGDERVNFVPSLSAVHLLFVLEHNRIAGHLQQINPRWDDETLFQETRKIVVALIQHIVYNEYLPPVLGRRHMDDYNLTFAKGNFYHDNLYDDQLDPTVTNVFSTAALRYGHSQIPDTQEHYNNNHEVVNITNIENTFRRPHFVEMNMGYGYVGVMRWMAEELTTKLDREFQTGVRNKLFQTKDGRSFDLPAISVQRGRDHGIPSYNEWREWCGLSRAKSFYCKTSGLVDHDHDAKRALASVYNSPEDIDLFAGAISERHVEDGSVGPTFACILSRQFRDLKVGDRFWYQNIKMNHSLEIDQLRQIIGVKLSDIICNNFDVNEIQPYVFHRQGVGNEYILCENLPKLDLSHWKSENRA